jgi:chemotaxis protein MotB
MAANNQTIIIKRIKKGGHGHHGGAWKVAYADFVTAMMAFFLLMWLLNATEAENLAGLADYFAPTVGVKDEMGIGFRGGKNILSDGIGADKNTNKGVVFGGVPTGPITKVTEEIKQETENLEQEQVKILIDKTATEGKDKEKGKVEVNEGDLQDLAKSVESYIGQMKNSQKWQDGSIEMMRTPEGLSIIIKDVDGQSMFKDNVAEMKDKLRDALVELAKILRNVPNEIEITGHTSSAQVDNADPNYGKWELSTDRANTARRFLEKNGVQKEQVSRVVGKADNLPVNKVRPEATENNRLSILLLNQSDIPSHKKSTPDNLFIDTKSDKLNDLLKDDKKSEDKKEEKVDEKMKSLIDDVTNKIDDEADKKAANPAKSK